MSSSPESKHSASVAEIITLPAEHVLATFSYPSFRRDGAETGHTIGVDGFTVQAVGPADYRVAAARDIEMATFSALGDPIEEVREEYLPYNEHSVYFLAFDNNSEAQGPKDIVGMGRMIPYTLDHPNKSLLDLAIIPGWEAEAFERTGIPEEDERRVIAGFLAESGCEDMSKVWDMSTMAPDLTYVMNGKMSAAQVAMSILAASAEYGILASAQGELTHVVSFNDQHAYSFFKKIGYPFNDLFGLGPMKYDSFGSDEGMMAQPAWFAADELIKVIAKADPDTYMGKIGIDLRSRGVLLDPDPDLAQAG